MLVSEVMLQQTQASRVADVFPRFLERFPNVRALAGAQLAEVIRAWTGLGYNRRAVALHRAARAIIAEHGDVVPGDPTALRTLPGVGPYTAAAVASIAYGVPVAAIDTNVRRVMTRLALGEQGDAAPAEVARAADDWLAWDAPGDWNQAVMNLGRAVCRPIPRCGECPVASACRFRADGRSGRRSRRTQPPFEGSMRQIRGGVVRELSSHRGSRHVATIAKALGVTPSRVEDAAHALERDGLVRVTPSGRLSLRADAHPLS